MRLLCRVTRESTIFFRCAVGEGEEGYCVELPEWMFDRGWGAGRLEGLPSVCADALCALRVLLNDAFPSCSSSDSMGDENTVAEQGAAHADTTTDTTVGVLRRSSSFSCSPSSPNMGEPAGRDKKRGDASADADVSRKRRSSKIDPGRRRIS